MGVLILDEKIGRFVSEKITLLSERVIRLTSGTPVVPSTAVGGHSSSK